MNVLQAAADLVLGTSCVGCGRPGALACDSCRAALRHGHLVRWLPQAELPVVASTWYRGSTVHLLRAHKDAGSWGLAGLLGATLTDSVVDLARLVPDLRAATPLVLAPIPSWPERVRERGYDHTAALARVAGRRLGWARSRRVLRRTGRGFQQSGLTRTARVANRAATLRAAPGPGVAVLVDDIVTTGATLGEAAAALREAGWHVAGAVSVALTARHVAGLTDDTTLASRNDTAREHTGLIETPPIGARWR